ncbi:unnamed protein product [Boreogadus saida]
MSPRTAILLLSFCSSLQDGLSFPSTRRPGEPGGEVISHHRTRRCSCNSRQDSECHYFCHLDIIWINTQSKTTIYGLGSNVARHRRAPGRCFCASPTDRTCSSFCVQSLAN